MNLDTPTLKWVVNIIEQEIEKLHSPECDDLDKDSKELALLRIIQKIRQVVKI